mmetsp:Transcript_3010/g.4585  ORF Transcript_3010/g.4585 Transcript_3010/m.4585 type:complete len:344 (-) Transcript_3010:21-1052(-)
MSLGIQTGAKYIAILFYSFREIYFTLLSTQYRAHISTLLGIPQSKYLATISGVISVTTAIGGYLVGIVVHQFGGVKGLVSTAAFAIIVSSLCFELSMRYCGRGSYRTKKKGNSGSGCISWLNLFRKNEVVRVLFVEALYHQIVATMLTLMFQEAIQVGIDDNSQRAVAVGHFFSCVNVISGCLQLFIVPSFLTHDSLSGVLLAVPILITCCLIWQIMYPGMMTVMLCYGALKVAEYSVLGICFDMVYMFLSSDVRYIGKELVRFFGQKVGRSVMSTSIGVYVHCAAPSQRHMSVIITGFALLWVQNMCNLTTIVPIKCMSVTSHVLCSCKSCVTDSSCKDHLE